MGAVIEETAILEKRLGVVREASVDECRSLKEQLVADERGRLAEVAEVAVLKSRVAAEQACCVASPGPDVDRGMAAATLEQTCEAGCSALRSQLAAEEGMCQTEAHAVATLRRLLAASELDAEQVGQASFQNCH